LAALDHCTAVLRQLARLHMQDQSAAAPNVRVGDADWDLPDLTDP
jgi:hypothetical protein